MTEWFVTSSVLIIIVLLLRALLKRKLSPRLRYLLWSVVLVRLLIPINFGSTDISVLNLSAPADNAVVRMFSGDTEGPVSEPAAPAPGQAAGPVSRKMRPSWVKQARLTGHRRLLRRAAP